MPRYKLTIEYDGTPFAGWQRQENSPSVQAAIEEAIFKLSGEQTQVFGAGRTDAGVHALGQVAHLDLVKEFTPFRLMEGLNFHLKSHPIAVLDSQIVDDDFHARFSAVGRSYLYIIINRRAPLTLDDHRAWQVAQELDAEAMNEAAKILVGQHDFTSFRASECQAKSPVKTLSHLEVSRQGDQVHISAQAPSFLHHQMRNITGTLYQVGIGRWHPQKVAEILAAKDRGQAGQTAPSDGLYLTGVFYPG